jgi:hypothetical protein
MDLATLVYGADQYRITITVVSNEVIGGGSQKSSFKGRKLFGKL